MGIRKEDTIAWSDERVELLKKLFEAGLTAREIAADLRGVTRNAVVGKLNRLGLSRGKQVSFAKPHAQTSPRTQQSSTIKTNKASSPSIVATLPLEEDELVIDFSISSNRVPLEGLTDDNCHWPIGMPGDEDFAFCGNRTESGIPYCPGHTRIAYRPTSSRRYAA